MFIRLFTLLFVFLSLPAFAQSEEEAPTVAGYVTAVDASAGFDVEGVHVRLNPHIELLVKLGKSGQLAPIASLGAVHLGESLNVYGKLDKKASTVTASRIVVIHPAPAKVNGTGIIDLIPQAAHPDGEHMVRADGYLLRLASKTQLTVAPPLHSADDLTTNMWIDYRGVQQSDGTILLDAATVRVNDVKHTEDKLRVRNEYDPASVDPDAKQGALSKAFLGVNPKKIPPYEDSAMQERINRIGLSLIPAFQRALPEDDATKINFRFQLIDSTKWRDALSLPNGIILVPKQVVERLQNDSQLAEVLADNIAEVMEKQTLRELPAAHKMTAAQVIGSAGGIVVPGLGLATMIANDRVGAHILAVNQQQSGRVSLFLMQDAGYDITQAPLAWWLLAPSKAKPLNKVSVPPRAANLYMALGTTWEPVLHPAQH